MKAGAVLRLMASAFALALSACGGGGGGSDAPASRPALPQLTSDAYPAGERLDLQRCRKLGVAIVARCGYRLAYFA